ncbi:COG1470 family protein [Gimesia aquarii]|uniref:Large cysteine-rich periplasmic protein OmcB n=1 Tax=Gimesia aquarii TaxID=2527964 RepID=A0A517VX13_9PLAN|nr:DUF11 domain-containing protein [Gimesia aquarii]QDT97545.1 Large cysteine-rich periplasmic protein OmcB precursor [Gimesia aquarii]
MSNVAIKLIAVTGVVGLGFLMFLQAQKGMQTGADESQMSQLESLDGVNDKVSYPDAPATVRKQTEKNTEPLKIPFSKVPAELSELAARTAKLLPTQKKKPREIPFEPNTKSSKIKLTAASDEVVTDDQKVAEVTEFKKGMTLEAPPKGLDFRESSEMKVSKATENPFSDSLKTPLEKVESLTPTQSEFKTGPQFGLPASDSTASSLSKETNPSEKIPGKENSVNPFKQADTASDQPRLSDQKIQPVEQTQVEENPFTEEELPVKKLENNEPPFEVSKKNTNDIPTIDSNPFMTVPDQKSEPKTLSIPPKQKLTPEVEPEFNPFATESSAKSIEPVPDKQDEIGTAPQITTENPEAKEITDNSIQLDKDRSPFNSDPKPKREPVSEKKSSDVVVIKKRKGKSSPETPPLFTIESGPRKVTEATPDPVELAPSPEPKPLSLVEENQPVPHEPAKLKVQQKIHSPKMTIQKMAPPEAVLGEPFIYHVLVKNIGTTSAQEVVVEDRIPKGAKLTGTIPRAEQINDRIIWRLGSMGPGVEKKISIRVIPEKAGQIGSVATVNFVTEVAAATKITSPKLIIQSDSPEAVKPGEITVVNYTITNSGSGDAKNVYVRSLIPPQFSHPGGDDIEYSVGVIPAGETKQIQLKLKAIKPGSGKNVSSVIGDGNLKAETEVPLKVVGNGEKILLTRKGPKNRYLGRSAQYENVITNNSEQPIQNISVFESIPPGMKFISASANGQFDPVRKVVQWDILELPASDQQMLSIELEPTTVGKALSTVQVVIDNSSKFAVNLQSETTILGQPLLKVETSELKGPLEVGEKMAMQVQLLNQGSASATNVEFRVKIPQELMFLSAKGPAKYRQAGSYVIFESTQELPAKQALDFELFLAARNKGDARVLVQVQSRQMEKPLNQEEAIPVLDKLQ